ncbi:unnamed protein product [Soboliphyme baturini]|uniref:Ubiquitin carboxyl-terminal hydrolase n=1 Tax=Soboliphyme baturini TaxID=241478 RepID=A0A183J3E8_9BILA|nr:unnamed protein product [Soboliphyme baturini]
MDLSSFAGNWCLIESDPGVFTELIRRFGKPVHGLIFLFKWRPNEEEPNQFEENENDVPNDLYFAKQVIPNACATQALINLVLNCDHPDVHIGSTLAEFKSFTLSFDPASRGLCLTNSENIRNVHNSFSCQTPFEIEETKKVGDAFHFVTYMPFREGVYELDGLKESPIRVGTIPKDGSWLDVVQPVLKRRIASYYEGEVYFSLMAVVSDRKLKLQRKLALLDARHFLQKETRTVDELVEASFLREAISDEEAKMRRYALENVRRRHNYIPLIVEFLKILAEQGRLVKLVMEVRESIVFLVNLTAAFN